MDLARYNEMQRKRRQKGEAAANRVKTADDIAKKIMDFGYDGAEFEFIKACSKKPKISPSELSKLLGHPEARVREIAAYGLGFHPKTGAKTGNVLNNPEAEIRKSFLQGISDYVHKDNAKTRVGKLGFAARALGKLFQKKDTLQEKIGILKEAITNPDCDVRFYAMSGLAGIGDAAHIPLFGAGLEDKDVHVRREATFGLGNAKHPDAVPFLQKAMTDKYVPSKEKPLGEKDADTLNKQVAVETLYEFAAGKNPELSKAAFAAISQSLGVESVLGLRERELIKALGKQAGHSDWRVRLWVTMHLGGIEHVDVIPLLEKMVRDPNNAVNSSAFCAFRDRLSKSRNPGIVEASDEAGKRYIEYLEEKKNLTLKSESTNRLLHTQLSERKSRKRK